MEDFNPDTEEEHNRHCQDERKTLSHRQRKNHLNLDPEEQLQRDTFHKKIEAEINVGAMLG
eukprot:15346902-Ditylum_brightwellii.AAC.2